MRIVSLVPHATELLFALGLGDQVVGVTHECDYPDAAQDLPQVTRDVLAAGMAPGEIDAAEEAGHHPDILVHGYKHVRLTLSTHSAGRVTDADHDLARRIDALA